MDPNDPSTWPASAREFYRRRFPAPPPESPLAPLLRERIRRTGPLAFHDFMAAALYSPEHGYYASSRSPVGPAGDFVTAPAHHPEFAALVARRLAPWIPAGSFTLVEMGAGGGELARGVLAGLARLGRPPERLVLVEPLSCWRERQAATLAGAPVEWVNDLEGLPPFRGAFVSNELPDAFPVHVVVRRDDGLRERYVGLHGDRFAWEEGPLSTPALADYFDRLGMAPLAETPVAVNLALEQWARDVAARLHAGAFLTLDYGGAAELLYREGRQGLRAYRGHGASDPLAAPGQQDLTAGVDFTTLRRAVAEAGLTEALYCDQRRFLLDAGLEETLREPATQGRRALLDLIDPRLMGETRALLAVRR